MITYTDKIILKARGEPIPITNWKDWFKDISSNHPFSCENIGIRRLWNMNEQHTPTAEELVEQDYIDFQDMFYPNLDTGFENPFADIGRL